MWFLDHLRRLRVDLQADSRLKNFSSVEGHDNQNFYKGCGLTVACIIKDEHRWPLSKILQKVFPYEVRTGLGDLKHPLQWSRFNDKFTLYVLE